MHVRPIIVSTSTSMSYVSLLGSRCLLSEVGKIYTLITTCFNFLFTRDNVKDFGQQGWCEVPHNACQWCKEHAFPLNA
jgi:hypothetical protein